MTKPCSVGEEVSIWQKPLVKKPNESTACLAMPHQEQGHACRAVASSLLQNRLRGPERSIGCVATKRNG